MAEDNKTENKTAEPVAGAAVESAQDAGAPLEHAIQPDSLQETNKALQTVLSKFDDAQVNELVGALKAHIDAGFAKLSETLTSRVERLENILSAIDPDELNNALEAINVHGVGAIEARMTALEARVKHFV